MEVLNNRQSQHPRHPDTFEMQPEWLEHAVIVMPARPKERITARFDKDVIAWFKEQGEGYQSRMNAVLRAYYEAQKKKLTAKTKEN